MSLAETITCQICGENYKYISDSHLRKHGYTSQQYRQEFEVDYLRSPALRARQSVARRMADSNVHAEAYAPASKEDILKKLIRISQKAPSPLTSHWLRNNHPSFFKQSENAFGTWQNLMEHAGLRTKKFHAWNKTTIKKGIRALPSDKRNDASAQRNAPALYSAANKYYGSWKSAIEACGLKYNAVTKCRSWTKDEILRTIRDLQQIHGIVSSKVVLGHSCALYTQILKRFENVETACRYAEVPFETHHRRWSKKLIVEELTQMRTAGHSLKPSHIQRDAKNLYSAMKRHFGSTEEALNALT